MAVRPVLECPRPGNGTKHLDFAVRTPFQRGALRHTTKFDLCPFIGICRWLTVFAKPVHHKAHAVACESMRLLIFYSLLLLLLTGCRRETTKEESRSGETRKTAPARKPPEAGSLPNAKLTPGATLDVTKDDICTPGYSKKVRDVPVTVKKQVYAEYNVQYVPHAYEVDHLISLELGGSNSIRNLWPESYSIYWNAHVKDALENRLHSLVCNGTVSMQDAQKAISTDWIAAYKNYFHTNEPLPNHRGQK